MKSRIIFCCRHSTELGEAARSEKSEGIRGDGRCSCQLASVAVNFIFIDVNIMLSCDVILLYNEECCMFEMEAGK